MKLIDIITFVISILTFDMKNFAQISIGNGDMKFVEEAKNDMKIMITSCFLENQVLIITNNSGIK